MVRGFVCAAHARSGKGLAADSRRAVNAASGSHRLGQDSCWILGGDQPASRCRARTTGFRPSTTHRKRRGRWRSQRPIRRAPMEPLAAGSRIARLLPRFSRETPRDAEIRSTARVSSLLWYAARRVSQRGGASRRGSESAARDQARGRAPLGEPRAGGEARSRVSGSDGQVPSKWKRRFRPRHGRRRPASRPRGVGFPR